VTSTSQLTAPQAVSPVELQRLRAAEPNVRVIDVRTGGEFETVHIPGSYNIPLDTLSEHANDLAAVDHPVVLVCHSGNRASQAQVALQSAGKSGLHVLQGGMVAWQETNGEVTHGQSKRWAMDRQVRLVAGSLVAAGILASVAVPKAKWFAGAVAGGLIFSAVTDTCAMAAGLARLPYNRTDGCDIDAVLHQLDDQQGANR
jgi:rhodanese-related sulfurtransferase